MTRPRRPIAAAVVAGLAATCLAGAGSRAGIGVDGQLAITGGRNMADQYFACDHAYDFRDRDALVIGAVMPTMRASFERL